MAHLRQVEERETPRGTLQEMLDREEQLDVVVVIALNKNGSQFLMCSSTSMHVKTFLVSFALSWVMQWFHHENAQ